MGNGRYGQPGISRNVKSQMGHLLNRVREKSQHYEDEPEYYAESDSDERMRYYDDDDSDDLQGRWEVRYDNQNYIRSMVNEDRGFHRIDDYPKHKWQISYDDRTSVENLEPYPVRVSIDHGDDTMAQWDRITERHGHLRNPYDYSSPEDEVIHSSYREWKPRRESYRYNRVERNVHDYETESIPEDEITLPHPREQRRRSTNIYRYGDVERNVHDIAGNDRYSRSAHQGTKTRLDAINKWRSAAHETHQNSYNEELERHYNQHGVEVSAHDYDENRAIHTAGARKRIVPMSVVDIMRNRGNNRSGHQKQPMSVVDIMRNRRNNRSGRQKQPLSVVDIMRNRGNNRSGRQKQFTEGYVSPRRNKVVAPRNLSPRVAAEYDAYDYDHIPEPQSSYKNVAADYDSFDYDDHVPAPQSLCEDVIEEHKDHPNDYGTTHEDICEEYVEGDDGSETWISSNERSTHIYHNSQ